MKRTRIISLFLSVLMAASSLPIAVSASDTADAPTLYNTELLSGDYLDTTKWSGIGVESADVDNTNKLLRMDERGAHSAQGVLKLIGANLKAKAADGTALAYTLTLCARTQGALVSLPDKSYYNMYFGIYYTNNKYGITASYQNATSEFAEYQFTLAPTEDFSDAEFKLRGGNSDSICPVEIDYAKITYPDNYPNEALKGQTITWNFNESVGATKNWSWTSGNTAQLSVSWVEDKDYIRVSAIEWDDTLTNSDDITARYEQAAAYSTGDIKLTPGKYELTFDARQSEFFAGYGHEKHNQTEYNYEYAKLLDDDSNAVPAKGWRVKDIFSQKKNYLFSFRNPWSGKDNKLTDSNDSTIYHVIYDKDNQPFHCNDRDVAVTLTATDGTTIETDTGTVNVDTEWATKTVEFTVPEGEEYTLSSISFGGTGLAYDNDEFDVSGLSLKLVELFHEDEPIGSDLLAGAAQNGGTTVDAVYDGYEKNGFITSDRLNWYVQNGMWNCDSAYFTLKLNKKYSSQYTYYVQYDIRHSVPTNDGQYIVTQIMGADALNYSLNGGAWSTTDEKGFPITAGGTDWETRTYLLPSGNYSGDVTVRIRRNRGTPRAQDIPVDIDNLVVWKEGADGDGVLTAADITAGNVLYNENFNNAKKSYTSTTAAYGKITGSINVNLYHNFDDEYVSAPAIEYTGLESLEDNGEGVYTFKADVRVPYFYYYNMRANGATELGTSEAAYKKFLAYNKHTVKVTYTMTDGTETKEKTVTRKEVLTTMWSTIETSVTVGEGYKLTGIKVTPVFNDTFAANVTADVGIDFRNVSLTKSEKQDGGLNIGIIMVLLKKKQAQLGTWDDPWDDPWEEIGFN